MGKTNGAGKRNACEAEKGQSFAISRRGSANEPIPLIGERVCVSDVLLLFVATAF